MHECDHRLVFLLWPLVKKISLHEKARNNRKVWHLAASSLCNYDLYKKNGVNQR